MSQLRTVALLAAIALGACAPLERSRETANPATPATTLAVQVCSICHGNEGNSVSPNFPNLAGQVEPYVEEQLTSFRKHSRSDPAGFEYMWGLSRGLTDAQVKGLAAYYAALPPMRVATGGAPDGRQIEQGKLLFEGGLPAKNVPACASCHGPQGAGLAAFPRLAGQHADYLVKQLLVFQRTDERPEGAIMKVIAHELTRADMEAVAAYLTTRPAR